MISFRIVEIPAMKAVMSGPIKTQEQFVRFGEWWTGYDKGVGGKLTPRDFMWYNEREQAREWIYALPVPETGGDYGGFEAKAFPFGLYVVASNIDADCDKAADWLATKAALEEYVRGSEVLELSTPENDVCERWPMFHIITPASYHEKTGIHQQDMYMPVVYKKK